MLAKTSLVALCALATLHAAPNPSQGRRLDVDPLTTSAGGSDPRDTTPPSTDPDEDSEEPGLPVSGCCVSFCPCLGEAVSGVMATEAQRLAEEKEKKAAEAQRLEEEKEKAAAAAREAAAAEAKRVADAEKAAAAAAEAQRLEDEEKAAAAKRVAEEEEKKACYIPDAPKVEAFPAALDSSEAFLERRKENGGAAICRKEKENIPDTPKVEAFLAALDSSERAHVLRRLEQGPTTLHIRTMDGKHHQVTAKTLFESFVKERGEPAVDPITLSDLVAFVSGTCDFVSADENSWNLEAHGEEWDVANWDILRNGFHQWFAAPSEAVSEDKLDGDFVVLKRSRCGDVFFTTSDLYVMEAPDVWPALRARYDKFEDWTAQGRLCASEGVGFQRILESYRASLEEDFVEPRRQRGEIVPNPVDTELGPDNGAPQLVDLLSAAFSAPSWQTSGCGQHWEFQHDSGRQHPVRGGGILRRRGERQEVASFPKAMEAHALWMIKHKGAHVINCNVGRGRCRLKLTPLYYACMNNRVPLAVVRALVVAGAELDPGSRICSEQLLLDEMRNAWGVNQRLDAVRGLFMERLNNGGHTWQERGSTGSAAV